MGRSLVVLVAVALVGVVTLSLAANGEDPPRAAQGAQPGFVGSDQCATCHQDQQASIARSVHGLARKSAGTPAAERGCETCHGPGAAHVADPRRDNIVSFTTASAAARSRACLSCHGREEERFQARRSEHQLNGVSCDTCHSVHTPAARPQLREATPQLCYACHQEVRAQFDQRFRHRVNERAMTCADCHNPHGSFEPKQVRRTATEPNPCVTCHTDKRGPFTYEHLSVRVEGCVTCHAPHGSVNRYLLRYQDQKALCLECHTATPAFHNVATPRFANCTTCHTQIHGSYLSRFFFE